MVEAIHQGRWNLVTRPLSWVFGSVVRLRHWLYDRGVLKQKRAPLPVVSVGNIVAGGVGKTQVTLLLAEALKKDVAVLSRGYRSCDEPKLLASRLPEAHVIVNRDRYTAAREAKRLGAKLAILDDGMQHRKLVRDVEIVVLGGADPFGGGAFLPRGMLREDPQRLRIADLVVFVGTPSQKSRERIASLTQSPCVETQVCVKKVHILEGATPPSLEGVKVGLFCGIGNPSRFVKSVEQLGAEVVATHTLPDHVGIGSKELRQLASLCQQSGAELLLCTEKDVVKLPRVDLPIKLGWVEVELEIVKNADAWEQMVKELENRIGTHT